MDTLKRVISWLLALSFAAAACASEPAEIDVRWANPCDTTVHVLRAAGDSFDDGVAESTELTPGEAYQYVGQPGVAFAIPELEFSVTLYVLGGGERPGPWPLSADASMCP